MEELRFATIDESIQYLANLVNKRIKIADYGDSAVSTNTVEQSANDVVEGFKGYFSEVAIPFLEMELHKDMQKNGISMNAENELKSFLKTIKVSKGSKSTYTVDLNQKELMDELKQYFPNVAKITDKSAKSIWSLSSNLIQSYGAVKGRMDESFKQIFMDKIESFKKKSDTPPEEVAQIMSDKILESISTPQFQEKYAQSPNMILSMMSQVLFTAVVDEYKGKRKTQLENRESVEQAEKEKIRSKQQNLDWNVKIPEDREAVNELIDFLNVQNPKLSGKMLLPIIEALSQKGIDNMNVGNVYKEGAKKWQKVGIKNVAQFYEVIRLIQKGLKEFKNKIKTSSFISVDEAIQHLSDLTGKTILIATEK